jgi:hypothetical protein
MKRTLFAAAFVAALAVPASADRAEDDLAAVRKAVGGAPQAVPRPPAEDPSPAPLARPRRSASEPQWFRVRVVEHGRKNGRVSINLPLGLVRALGSGVRLPDGMRREAGSGPTVGEVLRALDSGQSLVEIEDEEATVRIWVE